PARAPQRLRRQARNTAGRKRRSRPLVVGAERQRGEDPAAEPRGADAVPRITGSVVDPRAGLRPEEGQMIGGDVDRTAPRPRAPPRARSPPPPAGPGSRRRTPASARAAVGTSREKRSSMRPPKPIGPLPLPMSTRPSFVVRK